MEIAARSGGGWCPTLDRRRIVPGLALPLDHTQPRLPRTWTRARLLQDPDASPRPHHQRAHRRDQRPVALLRVVDLGIDARGTLNTGRISEIAAWRARAEELSIGVACAEAVRLAKRVRTADRELGDLTRQMTALLNESPAAGLLDQRRPSPPRSPTLLRGVAPRLIRSSFAFASLAGVNPIPASSGNTVRHRINRGGDRRLNRALHMAVVTRMRMDPETRAYVDKRTAQAHPARDPSPCPPSNLARQIYRATNATINICGGCLITSRRFTGLTITAARPRLPEPMNYRLLDGPSAADSPCPTAGMKSRQTEHPAPWHGAGELEDTLGRHLHHPRLAVRLDPLTRNVPADDYDTLPIPWLTLPRTHGPATSAAAAPGSPSVGHQGGRAVHPQLGRVISANSSAS